MQNRPIHNHVNSKYTCSDILLFFSLLLSSVSAFYVRSSFDFGQPGVCLGSFLGPPMQTGSRLWPRTQKVNQKFGWGRYVVHLNTIIKYWYFYRLKPTLLCKHLSAMCGFWMTHFIWNIDAVICRCCISSCNFINCMRTASYLFPWQSSNVIMDTCFFVVWRQLGQVYLLKEWLAHCISCQHYLMFYILPTESIDRPLVLIFKI